MVTNIFPKRSQAVGGVVGRTDPRKLLIVPVDFAKSTHVAQIARGTGEYLRKRPLSVHNTEAGAAWLLDRVESAAARLRVAKPNVIFGGEDPPEYVWNFVLRIRAAGYQFVRVNAKEAKRQRVNTRATSDELDLAGIAQTILLRRCYDIEARDEVFAAMKRASRSRRRLKRQETAVRNRIHRDADVLFPGFLCEKNSALPPFGEACLALMADRFSVMRVRRMRHETLIKRLRRTGARSPEDAAVRLAQLAHDALPPPPEIVPYLQKTLSAKIALLRTIRANIAVEENEMARALARTSGFLLTTIPGLGVVLAGGIVAEYGDPDTWPHPDNMASYAGIAVRSYQTGGPDVQPRSGALPSDANRHLKDQILQAAHHTGQYPHPAWRRLGLPGQHPLFETFRDIELREGCSRLGTAKKLLRIARAMVRDRQVYLPAGTLDPDSPDALSVRQYADYLETVGEMLKRKWKSYDLDDIPEEHNHLDQWRKTTDELIAHVRIDSN